MKCEVFDLGLDVGDKMSPLKNCEMLEVWYDLSCVMCERFDKEGCEV